MLELGVKTLLAYLLGSLLGSLLVGQLRGVDIRQQGSGNAGGTNALRTQGWGFALGVIEGLTKYFYPEASNTVVFVLMVLVLLVKPTGLTGRPTT